MVKFFIAILLASGFYTPVQDNFYLRLSQAAVQLTQTSVTYDPKYTAIPYPMGDVPANKGVCSDVVIRAYRTLGIDLQKEVHEDMAKHFGVYPKKWGLRSTDKNIDHRRVPNLMVFFKRHGTVKPITQQNSDYAPGDIVCWNLKGDITHIGLVVNKYALGTKRPLIVHNIGAGQVVEDALFSFPIIGHYSYKK
jgi:uncharacterized protein